MNSSENLTEKEKREIMQRIRQEVVVANTSQILVRMTEKCFQKCIIKPGTSLDSSEQKCVAMCMDRYVEAYAHVHKAYSERVQKEYNRM